MWLVFAVAASVIWGVNYAASGRLLARGLSPAVLFLADLVIGSIIIALFLLCTGQWRNVVPQLTEMLRHERTWLFTALIASSLGGLLIFMAIEGKNATVASLIEITYPLFTAFFVWYFFREATLNLGTIGGGILIAAGVLCVYFANK